MIWGYDVSHYQPNFDHARARREGFDFAILKATEGNSFIDNKFRRHLDAARSAGMIVAAYHYVRGNVSAASQADHIARNVPRDVPVILDVEDGGGQIGVTRDLNGRLNAMGFRTPLLYLPEWYWKQIGSPSLRGLPPLWYSRYPNNNGGSASGIYNANRAWLDAKWGGYGGLPVEVLQFTSSATIAGTYPTDANAYRGNREQLAALFGGAVSAPSTPSAPGGIESMAFGDQFKDWAGNDQNVLAWMNHVDSRIWEIHNFLFAPGSETSRIPGDQNRTNGKDAIMDTVARASIGMALTEQLHDKLNDVQTPDVNLDELAEKVVARLGNQIADAVANKIAERMAQ